MRRHVLHIVRATVATAAAVSMAVGLAPSPASASVDFVTSIVQEPGEFEARFPDILKLGDGSLMAVWHRATSHANSTGTIRLSFGSADGRTWSTPTAALSDPGVTSGIDARDPKIGLMNDGSVVLTFFVPGGRVFYSVWKPGWHYFTPPEQLTSPDLSVPVYSHGSALALADSGGQTNQVLIPIYTGGTGGGVHFIKATWRPTVAPRLLVSRSYKIMNNANPAGRVYSEPSFVQIGTTVVTAVRSQQDGEGSPVIIVRFNPYAATPDFSNVQSFTGVLANSHHLLKVGNQVLFTYGDKARPLRPTVGMMITNPTGAWVRNTVVPIYNSGNNDQANPSSVDIGGGRYLTLGYNAKTKAESSSGGTLWVLESHASDY